MKFRGNIIVSYEMLKEALKLPKDVDILNIYVSEKDMERDTFTVALISNTATEYTVGVAEASQIPHELYDNYLINKRER